MLLEGAQSLRMNMYYVAVVLPSHLNEKISFWKKMMYERYQCKVGLKSPAHITLIPPFWMEETQEQAFLNAVDGIASSFTPFVMRTHNFSAFKPRTIFIDVVKNEQLHEMKKTVDDYFRQNDSFPLKIDTRPFHPHITIATRDLFKKSFHEVWPYFEQEKFEEEWEANSISVLRYNKKNWDVIQTSQFQSM